MQSYAILNHHHHNTSILHDQLATQVSLPAVSDTTPLPVFVFSQNEFFPTAVSTGTDDENRGFTSPADDSLPSFPAGNTGDGNRASDAKPCLGIVVGFEMRGRKGVCVGEDAW